MTEKEARWVARLTLTPAVTVDDLLGMPMGLDIWERHDDVLVGAASERQLSELERRRLAQVERLSTVAEYEARAQRTSPTEGGGSG